MVACACGCGERFSPIGSGGRPRKTVHHRNGVRHDNRPENLELRVSTHPKGQAAEDVVAWAREILDTYGPLVAGS
jgi:hypothetical protein